MRRGALNALTSLAALAALAAAALLGASVVVTAADRWSGQPLVGQAAGLVWLVYLFVCPYYVLRRSRLAVLAPLVAAPLVGLLVGRSWVPPVVYALLALWAAASWVERRFGH